MSQDPTSEAAGLVETARAAGVTLWFEGSRLRFRAKPGAMTDELRSDLRDRRDEVVAHLRLEADDAAFEAPAAANQLGLWLVQELAPESAAYNVAFAARVLSPLDEGALEEALQIVVDRHEALRTAYVPHEDGRPRRLVLGQAAIELRRVSVERRTEAQLREAVEEAYAKPFDMTRAPLLRAHLFQRSATDRVFLLTAHHIVVDGQALFVLLEELFEVYGALVEDRPVPPKADGADFQEFVEWQQGLLASKPEMKEYWDAVLDPPPAPLNLPTDRPRQGTPRMTGGIVEFSVGSETVARLDRLSASSGVTDFIVLLSAWGAFLHHLTGSEDVVVGSPVHGRPSVRFARTVGDFVNVVPFRTTPRADSSFRALVEANRGAVREGLTHQDYPLPLMVAEREDRRGRGAPFETLFAYQDFGRQGAIQRLVRSDGETVQVGPLALKSFRIDQQAGQFALQLDIWREEDRWLGALRYDNDLFDEATAEMRAAEFVALLSDAARRPDEPIGRLDPIPEAERRLLLDEWNSTSEPQRWAGGLPATLVGTAARVPDREALTGPSGSWTYEELLQNAQRVTAGLRAMGVGSGDRVVILMDRGRGMVAAMIGALGAGAAYVPLDPTYPDARIRQVIRSSEPTAVLTDGQGPATEPGLPRVSIEDLLAGEPEEFEPIAADDPAYVIYTSGSTGEPKGVEIPHAAMVNFLEAMIQEPGIGEDDVVLAVTTVSFDISVLELFAPIATGGRVVIASSEAASDPDEVIRLLEAEHVTIMQATPATWKMLVGSGWRGHDPLRVLCGGEALPSVLAEKLLDRVPELWNMYGPTETTVWSAAIRIEDPDDVTIGRPIRNTRLYVLDDDRRLRPVGVPGELWIGGSGVATGYLGRPALTAERFVESPFVEDDRLYRTGDFVRYRNDGRLEYLGRLDDQVKVRGFRVELGEVEAVLRTHEAVRDAVACARGDRLLAYVIGEDPTTDPGQLRRWISGCLPGYMVPSIITLLDDFPLTENGKVDRHRLPDPTEPRTSPLEGAATDTEVAIARIWQRVLNTPSVGRHDDFFALGGHSLMATEVVSRIRDALGAELPLRTFFDAPTVSGIARWLDEQADAATDMPPIRSTVEGAAPLSFSQERMWFLQMLDGESVAYNMVGALLLEGPLDTERLRSAFERIARRQDSLRTRIENRGGRPVQVVDEEPTHDFQVVDDIGDVGDIEGERADRRARAAEAIVGYLEDPYDLDTGPLVRVMVVRLGPDEHMLGVGMHHIVSDLWSFFVLGREVASAYDDPEADQPPSEVTYRDYSVWQRNWLESGRLETQLSYWREKLASPPTLDLPTDYPRPRFASSRGALVRAPLPEPVVEGVARLVAANKATPFMAYLAAFKALLRAHSGQTDLSVGVPIANRTQTAIEGLIGSFVNTLIHRNDLSGDPTFTELLTRVRATAVEAFQHQDMPFEALVKELDPARDTSRSPLFQVLFNMANVRADGIELEGFRSEPYMLPRRIAQFDLTLDVGLNEMQSDVMLQYATGLYSKETAQRLLAHYVEILERSVEDPDRPLSELARIPSADLEDLDRWNRTDDASVAGTSLPELVQKVALDRRDQVAVRSGGDQWTYGETVDFAHGVAGALRDLGVEQGDRVVILLERGREMLGALLGVLGAGAVYVPVDPAYPRTRVRYIVESSKATAAISHRGLARDLGIDLPTLDLNAPLPETPGEFHTSSPDESAYVIYTSGSTGKPKGVEISHGALSNFLQSMVRTPGVSEADTLLAVTTISFDIAALELYTPLMVGGCVVIAAERDVVDGHVLARKLDEEQITLMQATPATWKLLCVSGWEGKSDLRALCGGEALPASLASQLLDRVGELWNMYGPTETTVWSTVEQVRPEEPISIGRPIANTTVYVLDDQLARLPIGVPGELWIGGDGVAEGYFGRPDLTTERFIESPFREGERIYKTGDLVRFRSDGRLEHLGRLDHQVKIRGHRIELGEVEFALRSHPGIHDAVVVPAAERLIGYLVEGGDAPTVSELRQWIGDRLPQYMMPSIFVPIAEIPLTPNGKVDRSSLPDPARSVAEETTFQPLESPNERIIGEVWRDLLAVDRIGRSDNFFELGGHSLLAMEATSLVEDRTGHRLDPRALFFKSLGQLAEALPDGEPGG